MSREWGEGDDSYMPQALFRQAVELALNGKRGQRALRDLEAALLELPAKRLISNHLCKDGEVCALGALALYRGVRKAEMTKLEKKLWDIYEGVPPGEVSAWAADKIGVREALATEIQWQNDEEAWWGDPETPEQRYERVLAWVRSQIKSEAAA